MEAHLAFVLCRQNQAGLVAATVTDQARQRQGPELLCVDHQLREEDQSPLVRISQVSKTATRVSSAMLNQYSDLYI